MIHTGYYNYGHIQGIACDGRYLYCSFTTALIKLDMDGNFVGSVTGFLGHLGCIALYGGHVYGSLEYKNDSIGRGILSRLGTDVTLPDAFYVVKIDACKIDRADMDAERDGIVRAVKLTEVCDDYKSGAHGCSGIDGITVGGYPDGNPSLFVAYGIYGDTSRDDNDDQVLLRLDMSKLDFKPLSQDFAVSTDGIKADDKYFVYTGNTTYGIQNLEYDSFTNCFFAAVYHGKKPQFPNYPMFMIDLDNPPKIRDGKQYLPLKKAHLFDKESGIYGLDFSHGSTGMISLGNGMWYFSKDGKSDKGYYSEIVLCAYDEEDGFYEL